MSTASTFDVIDRILRLRQLAQVAKAARATQHVLSGPAAAWQGYAFCPTGKGGGIDNSCSPTGNGNGAATDELSSISEHHSSLGKVTSGIMSAVEGRPERLTHGNTGKNAFFIVGNKVYSWDKYGDIPEADRRRAISVHSHSPDGTSDEQFFKNKPSSKQQTLNSDDISGWLKAYRQGHQGPQQALIFADGTMDLVSITKDTNPAALKVGRKKLEGMIGSTYDEAAKAWHEKGMDREEYDRSKARAWFKANGFDFREGLRWATPKQAADLRAKHPAPEIRASAKHYASGLFGRGAAVTNAAHFSVAPGQGYKAALLGIDFTDLAEQRRKLAWYLEQQGVDAEAARQEVMGLNHSWEFAAYAFCPTGEGGGVDNSCSSTGEPALAPGVDERIALAASEVNWHNDTARRVVVMRAGKTAIPEKGPVFLTTEKEVGAIYGPQGEPIHTLSFDRKAIVVMDTPQWYRLVGEKALDYDEMGPELFDNPPPDFLTKLQRAGYAGFATSSGYYIRIEDKSKAKLKLVKTYDQRCTPVGVLNVGVQPTLDVSLPPASGQPIGKSFMQLLGPWRGQLDLTPGSAGLRLFDRYRELRAARKYSFPDHKGRPGEIGGSLPRVDEGQGDARINVNKAKHAQLSFIHHAKNLGFNYKVPGDNAYQKSKNPRSKVIRLVGARGDKVQVFEEGKGRYEIDLLPLDNPWLKKELEAFKKRAYDAYQPDEADPGVMVAVRLPADVAEQLAVEGGNEPDQLHCTLAYLGKLSTVDLATARSAITSATAGATAMTGLINGLGRFGASESSDGKEVVYATLDCPGLAALRTELVERLTAAGVEVASDHDFAPHITLSYVEPGEELDVPLPDYTVPVTALHLVYGDTDEEFQLGAKGYEWDEAKHPREPAGSETGGQFAPSESGSGETVGPPSRAVDEHTALKLVEEVARTMGMKAYANKIQIHPNEQGREITELHSGARAGAAYDPATGLIHIYQGGFQSDSISGVLAHEITHARFDQLEKQRDMDYALMINNSRRFLDRTPTEAEKDQEWNNFKDDPLKPNGELKPEYYTRYAAQYIWDKYYGGQLDKLAKADGVTDYSKQWWAEAKKDRGWTKAAVNETLAEIGYLDWKSKTQGEPGHKINPVWQGFYRDLVKYSEYSEGFKKGTLKFQGDDHKIFYFDDQLNLVDKGKATLAKVVYLSGASSWVILKPKQYADHQPSQAERRCDFAALKAIYDAAPAVNAQLAKPIIEARDSLLHLVENQDRGHGLTAEFAQSLKIDLGKEFSRAADGYLMGVWRRARDLALLELPESLQSKLKGLKRFATAFKPDVAGNYLANRALFIKNIVDDELTKNAKLQLFEHLKGGRTLNETMGNLRAIFEPWIGSPKIEPSGITYAPEDVLQPYRLENVVRTETATAMAQGRAAVADAASDYVLGYELSAILDDRTTHICELADGIKFKLDDPRAVKLQPPLWFNCRTVALFVTVDDEPVDWSSEAELDRVVREIPEGFK